MTTTAATGNSTGTLSSDQLSALNTRKSNSALATAKEQSDRFLKLLTTQLQNQDPMNPMDNAQMTSQMAQISTVTGVETLNASLQALSSQFVQMQALQGAAMVGRQVMVAGDRLAIAEGMGKGSYDLGSSATGVKVDVLNSAGGVVQTIQMGAQDGGRHTFEWNAGNTADSANYRFRVSATGTGGSAVTATTLMHDTVQAVNTGGTTLQLQLQHSGSVGYDGIKALN